uniref:Uncharacterized protein n=1 Tax=Setaria viridis TaxID=4556 RepID=A0A4U6VA28_SETVI|nr:hypothetical protein SEVIR_3G166200v2 [Setaria viridis]
MFGWRRSGLGSSHIGNIPSISGFIRFFQNEGTVSTQLDGVVIRFSRSPDARPTPLLSARPDRRLPTAGPPSARPAPSRSRLPHGRRRSSSVAPTPRRPMATAPQAGAGRELRPAAGAGSGWRWGRSGRRGEEAQARGGGAGSWGGMGGGARGSGAAAQGPGEAGAAAAAAQGAGQGGRQWPGTGGGWVAGGEEEEDGREGENKRLTGHPSNPLNFSNQTKDWVGSNPPIQTQDGDSSRIQHDLNISDFRCSFCASERWLKLEMRADLGRTLPPAGDSTAESPVNIG